MQTSKITINAAQCDCISLETQIMLNLYIEKNVNY